MSSRSLAAARARRAGENTPPVSGNRPGTSIGSSAAFSQQMPPPPNGRLARPPQQQNAYPPSQAYPSQAYPQSQAYQQVQQSQQQSQNGLPFTKLSISDAIGLITMRLGRCEQWIIETEHETDENAGSSMTGLPENSRIIDNSVLTNLVNRLDSLEKREPINGSSIDNDAIGKLSEDFTKMNEHLAKIVEEASKHSLITSKHTEQLYKFERELVETKDILKTFMLKYDLFTSDTNDKLGDFEFAISEMEKNFPVAEEAVDNVNTPEKEKEEKEETENSTLTADLKSLVKQELAAENM
jgi:hypothetical protein